MLILANAFLVGTVVLAIRTTDAIHVGIDSKVIVIDADIGSAPAEEKSHKEGDVVFAHAGIFKDKLGKLDVAGTARTSIRAGGSLEQIVIKFTMDIEPQLLAVLPEIRAQNPQYFREKLKRPEEILFASMGADNVPKMIVVIFEKVEEGDTIKLKSTRQSCPPDCPGEITSIGLGEHAAADAYLDSHQSVLRQEGAATAIHEAIKAQAAATPEYVALPVKMWSIDQQGVHERDVK
jgi:hypothetical protein